MKNGVFIGLTYGDPAGIGPEILLKTLTNWKFKFKPLVIGIKKCLIKKDEGIKVNKNLNFYSHYSQKAKDLKCTLSKPSKFTGIHSYLCLKDAVHISKNKQILALITGPVSKEAINLAGVKFSGQTDEIAKLCKVNKKNVIMLFVANDLRLALYTRHIPLKAVSSKLNKKELKQFILLLNKELKKRFHIQKPKIAILGLNPHASEGGLFGDEEKKTIIPVINKLKSSGIKLFGPLSPDATLAIAGQRYLSNKKQDYDVYISFYHDQALPMFKAVAGMKGVNVTLGLPFLRVAVDHGTAFDIAGKNKASNEGFISTIRLIENLFPDK